MIWETYIKIKHSIREFRLEDAESIHEMYNLIGWPTTIENVRRWAEPNQYTRRIVVEHEGKAVGKVTLDLVNKPYSEFVNLIVHPDYRRQGYAIALVDACIKMVKQAEHPLMFLKTERDNFSALNLYNRNGFIHTIMEEEGEVWLLNLPPMKTSPALTGRTEFYGRNLYRVSTDSMHLYFEGQPGQPRTGGTAPRIAGLSYRDKETSVDLIVQDEIDQISIPGKASFNLIIHNNGLKLVHLKDVDYIHAEGIKVTPADNRPRIIDPDDSITLNISTEITGEYHEPILSFTTILISCYPRIEGLPPIPVTAGFERT